MSISIAEKMYLIECLREFSNRSKLKCTIDDCSLSGRLDIRFSTVNGKLIHHSSVNVHQLTTDDIPRMLSNIYGVTAYALSSRVNSTQETSVFRSGIKNVIFNAPATIVFWYDGTKTVVKCAPGEVYDPEKGLAMAMAKKMLGNEGNYYNIFKKWLPEEDA